MLSEALAAVHRMIVLRPDDYAPREIYADLLDDLAMEQDVATPTPRAEFIRLQCRARQRGDAVDPNCVNDLGTHYVKLVPGPGRKRNTVVPVKCVRCWEAERERINEIRNLHARDWLAATALEGLPTVSPRSILGEISGPEHLPITWVGGFVQEVELTQAWLWQSIDKLCADWPITHIHVPELHGTRDYGGGDERPAVWQDSMPDLSMWIDVCDGDPRGADYRFREFPTHLDAESVVSRAAVRLGRRRAFGEEFVEYGDPPLPPVL